MKSNELANKVENHFNISELKALCFDLNLDHKDIPADTRKDLVRELILHFERRNRIDELISVCKSLRPNVAWGTDDSSIVLRDSPTIKVEDSPWGIRQWANKNYKLILSFGIAFFSLLAGIIASLVANRISVNLSWQNLEPIVSLVVVFLTLIVFLRNYLRRESKTEINTGNEGSNGGHDDE